MWNIRREKFSFRHGFFNLNDLHSHVWKQSLMQLYIDHMVLFWISTVFGQKKRIKLEDFTSIIKMVLFIFLISTQMNMHIYVKLLAHVATYGVVQKLDMTMIVGP